MQPGRASAAPACRRAATAWDASGAAAGASRAKGGRSTAHRSQRRRWRTPAGRSLARSYGRHARRPRPDCLASDPHLTHLARSRRTNRAHLLRSRRQGTTPLPDVPIHRMEGCRSGRTGRSRKPLAPVPPHIEPFLSVRICAPFRPAPRAHIPPRIGPCHGVGWQIGWQMEPGCPRPCRPLYAGHAKARSPLRRVRPTAV